MPFLRRRELLSGVGLFAGAPLLGALCRNMTPDALGQTVVRKRIFMYLQDGGLGEDCFRSYPPYKSTTESFVPSGNPDGTIKLGSGYAPLQPYVNQMTFLHDLYHPFNAYNHSSHYFLSAAQMPGVPRAKMENNSTPPGPPPGITLDRLIGKAIGDKDQHSSLFFRGSGWSGLVSCEGPNALSTIYVAHSPQKSYAALFGGGLPGGGGDPAATAAYLADRRSVFDFLRGDLGRLNARLSAPERAKMDQYVDSIRRVETRLSALADPTKLAACTKPASGPAPVGGYPYANLEQLKAAGLDIAVTALECGLTKVVAVVFGSGEHSFLGNGLIGTHTMQHGFGDKPFSMPANEMHKRYYNYHANSMKTVLDRLSDRVRAREGNGTMMDNSLVVNLGASGVFHHGGASAQYAWLIGSAGGYFKKNTNRHIKYETGTHSTSDVFVSIAKAMGVTPKNAAGTPDRFGTERSPGPEFNATSRYKKPYPTVVNTGPNLDLT